MRRIELPNKKCVECGKLFSRGRLRSGREECIEDFRKRMFCSRECFFKHNSGEHHWRWKGGIKRRPDGYLRNSKTDEYIHRETMEHYLGRKLRKEECIHHINGNPSDNRIENLEILTNSEHKKLHLGSKTPRDSYGKFKTET